MKIVRYRVWMSYIFTELRRQQREDIIPWRKIVISFARTTELDIDYLFGRFERPEEIEKYNGGSCVFELTLNSYDYIDNICAYDKSKFVGSLKEEWFGKVSCD